MSTRQNSQRRSKSAAQETKSTLFELVRPGGWTLSVLPWTLQGDFSVHGDLLGEATYRLSRKIGLTCINRSTPNEVISFLPPGQERHGVEISLGRMSAFAVPGKPIEIHPGLPDYREALRRLIANELKRVIVYERNKAWYRSKAYYRPQLRRKGGGHLCDGVRLEVVILEDNRICLALDHTVTALGPDLAYACRRDTFDELITNPYRPESLGDGDRAWQKKDRNFVAQDRDRCRRVYLDRSSEPSSVATRLWVKPTKGNATQEEREQFDLERLYPVLAPKEVTKFIPSGAWRTAKMCEPEKRRHNLENFIQGCLQDMPMFLKSVSVPSEPVSDPGELKQLKWPHLSVGPNGHPANIPQDLKLSREKALQEVGYRHWPSRAKRLSIAYLEGQSELASELLKVCEEILCQWHLNDKLTVDICPVEVVSESNQAEALHPLREYLRSLTPSERPQLLLVMKPETDRKDWGDDPLYRGIYQLGNDLNISTKPMMLSSLRKNFKGGAGGHSYVKNLFPELFLNAGAIPFGIRSPEQQRPFVHDLVFGVDIGGKDRSHSERGGNAEYASFVAFAGADIPSLRWPTSFEPFKVDGEILDFEHLEEIVLESARAKEGNLGLPFNHQGSWLYLRDGRMPDQEWDNLKELAETAREEGLLPEGASFTVVEVYKKHPIRLVHGRDSGKWEHIDAGTCLWLKESPTHSEAILATTGRPWSTQSTEAMLRCHIRTVHGQARHREAIEDIWKLCFLNWNALNAPFSLPLPLHAAQKLTEHIQRRGSPTTPF